MQHPQVCPRVSGPSSKSVSSVVRICLRGERRSLVSSKRSFRRFDQSLTRMVARRRYDWLLSPDPLCMTCTTYGKQAPPKGYLWLVSRSAVRLPFYRGLACIFVSCRCRVAERSCQQRNPDSASGIGTRRYHRWRDNAFIFDLWQFDKLCSNTIESLACKVANNKYPGSFIFRKFSKKRNSIYFNLNC